MIALFFTLALGALVACIHALMTAVNLARYATIEPDARSQDAPRDEQVALPLVSVCIPARNEAANIEACVRSIFSSASLVDRSGKPLPPEALEVVVYDDQSSDATPRILADLAASEPRLVRAPTVPLPSGWNGKQHACWRMSSFARGAWLLFTDADVRFAPGCIPLALRLAQQRGVGLLSTFPRQITGTFGETLLVPMIFFLLFAYLPMGRMRRTLDPAASAACGQFLFVRRDAYDAIGGHSAFKDSMHDGVKMPRLIRRAGFKTDLFDATTHLSCRMYQGFAQTWRGFAKNAYEGLGSVALLVFLTIVNALGHWLPWVVLPGLALATIAAPPEGQALASAGTWWRELAMRPESSLIAALVAVVAGLSLRVLIARRLRVPLITAIVHPLGVLAMTLVQWHSLYLHLTGRRTWRGRVAGAPSAA